MNRDILIWLAIAGLLIAGTGTAIYMGARGIRNNNPGNIRRGSSQWQGMSAEQTDKSFVQFDDPVYGIRALAKLLKNYQSRYGLNTIEEIISRYAPPSENITGAYVSMVAKAAGVNPRQEILIDDYLQRIIPAMIKQENGSQPYPMSLINDGIRLS